MYVLTPEVAHVWFLFWLNKKRFLLELLNLWSVSSSAFAYFMFQVSYTSQQQQSITISKSKLKYKLQKYHILA